MKEKAIQAAEFLETVRVNCRILNKDNLPLMGMEHDSIEDAIQTLRTFARQANLPDEKLVNPTPNPQ